MFANAWSLILSFAKSFEGYSGFWSFFQGAVATVGIVWAVWYPNTQNRKLQVDNFIAIRNICWVTARYLDCLTIEFQKDRDAYRGLDELNYCNFSLQTIDLNTVRPAELISRVIHLQGMSLLFIKELQNPVIDVARLRWISGQASGVMEVLDGAVVAMGGKFTKDDERMAFH
ncbi:hypothetical protein [Azorhizobium sp. AG788]|uniref:hypothetical protein n=1 Tax=Azorhizobium sp. AG788 TaxID=2183897 RepID=UPI00313A392A